MNCNNQAENNKICHCVALEAALTILHWEGCFYQRGFIMKELEVYSLWMQIFREFAVQIEIHISVEPHFSLGKYSEPGAYLTLDPYQCIQHLTVNIWTTTLGNDQVLDL